MSPTPEVVVVGHPERERIMAMLRGMTVELAIRQVITAELISFSDIPQEDLLRDMQRLSVYELDSEARRQRMYVAGVTKHWCLPHWLGAPWPRFTPDVPVPRCTTLRDALAAGKEYQPPADSVEVRTTRFYLLAPA